MGDDGEATQRSGIGSAPWGEESSPQWKLEMQRVHAELFPDVEAKSIRVGRFEVLRRLGRGGMGEVFVAYDEQLDREVALKLLLNERSEDEHARDRLLREAQVLARVSHPNVVQIHEAGIHEGQVYLAMELVDGITLRDWLDQTPEGAATRPWPEVLEVMSEAGRGLAAAHAAGLTHRDFKPDNVLVGSDGRVRVLDFGLARPGSDDSQIRSPSMSSSIDDSVGVSVASGSHAAVSQASGSSSSTGSRRGIAMLTEPGRVVGTLAYMSPEQLAAMPLDARSDQFSFCVTLYEALYGERPFKGRTFAAYLLCVTQGMYEEPATRGAVPRWLRAAVRRGLAVAPGDRFADMDALLRELGRTRERSWKLGVAAIVLLGAGGALALAAGQPRPCQLDQSELMGTWDEGRREALQAAFAESGATAQTTEQALSEWSDAWLAGMRSACEATRIAGTQSEAMLDHRTGCLQRKRREVEGTIDVLTHADGTGAEHALELLGTLPDLETCADPRLAQSTHPLPAEPELRETIQAAYGDIGRARALGVTARIEDADALTERLESVTASLGYLPLSLEVRRLQVERALWRMRIDEAVPLLREMIQETEIAGFDELSAELRTELAFRVVGKWGRAQVQAMFLEEARTAVARLGRPADRRSTRLLLAEAVWHENEGNHERGVARYEEVIAQARAREHYDLAAHALRSKAHFLVQLRRFDDAADAYAQARALYEWAVGPSPTYEADEALHLGLLELGRERLDAAETHLDRARALHVQRGREYGTGKLELAEAKLAFFRGDFPRAGRAFEVVAETSRDDRHRAEAWEALGVIRFYQGEVEDSLDAYRRARPLRLATFGPDDSSVGILESNIGESLAASGDHRGALDAYASSLRQLEVALPAGHASLAYPYKGRGKSRLALGNLVGARLDLEQALRLHEQNPGEPVERADVEATLARLLLELGERARALALARDAHQRLFRLGHQSAASEVERWLAEHS